MSATRNLLHKQEASSRLGGKWWEGLWRASKRSHCLGLGSPRFAFYIHTQGGMGKYWVGGGYRGRFAAWYNLSHEYFQLSIRFAGWKKNIRMPFPLPPTSVRFITTGWHLNLQAWDVRQLYLTFVRYYLRQRSITDQDNAALEPGSKCASLIIKGIRHCIRKCQTLIARKSANDQTCLHVLSVF